MILNKSIRSGGSHITRLFLLEGLVGSLGRLAGLFGLVDSLDDTDSNGLSHVAYGKSSKRWVLVEGLDTHWLAWNHLDDGSITRLDKLGGIFNLLTSSAINLLDELRELACNVGSVAIEHRRVSSTNLTWVVEDDNLGVEGSGFLGWLVLGVRADKATSNFLDRDVLDVEANVVSWDTLNKLFVVHLDGLDFSGDTGWGKGDDHTGLDDTGFDTSDWHCSDTANLVDILKRKTEWLVGWTHWWLDGIDSIEEGLALDDTSLGLLLPALVPWHVGGSLQHVVSVPSRDRDESNGFWVVSDLLDEVGCLLDNFVETILGPLGGVHLIDGDNELSYTEGVSEESVLTGLTILGNTGFEFTSTTSNDKDSAIGLGGTSNHVLDEITVTWSVDNGNVVFWCLELPESDIDGDTTLTLGLQFVENPGIFEGTLSQFSGFLLELLDGTL